MKLIGLTGGIGSGKTVVASLFKLLGIPVYESDARAKAIMLQEEVQNQIMSLLGNDSYHADGVPDTQWIASQVFRDGEKLKQLNAIIHPAVYQDLIAWAEDDEQRNAPYLIQESAILFEENLTDRFEAVILVTADTEERINRVMLRDHVDRDKVVQRMQYQWEDSRKIPLADYVIYNDNGRSLITQVRDIDSMIRSLVITG